MVNLLEEFNNQQIKTLKKEMPEFRPGDDIKVTFRIVDGANERMQIFEGVCISKRNRGLHSSFTARKVSHKESILFQFFVYSPALVSVEVTRKGKVRRAKLYYLCKLFGKAARIKERTNYTKKNYRKI